MASNGHKPSSQLRVLLSGPAADAVAGTLERQPAISMIRAGADGNGISPVSADVTLHVLESSSAAGVAEAVQRLRQIADTPLILAAYGESHGIVETGIAVGAADVLMLPQPAETLLFAIRKAAIAANGVPTGKVVTVFSPKGGSGKTALATNLAAASARAGVETLLVDLDLQFGDSALTLAVSPRATIADLAASAGAIDIEKLKAFVSEDAQTGLSVLPAPQRPEEADVVGQADLSAVLDSARNAYGAVVIDTGPLFDGPMLAALDHTDELLLVCNPEVTSLKNVRIGLETIERLGFERDKITLVANRIGAAGGIGRSEIEQALDAEVAYELPDDSAVPVAVNRAVPVVVSAENSPFSRAVSKLASTVFASAHAREKAPSETSQRRFLLRGRR
jgi:MinD-like ATPase involved in chromosome partitioning or flagellar assembly